MEDKYYDLLLVEKMDGHRELAVADSCNTAGDCMVELEDGELACVVKTAWLGKKDEDLFNLLQTFCGPSFSEVKAIYRKTWKKETADEGT